MVNQIIIKMMVLLDAFLLHQSQVAVTISVSPGPYHCSGFIHKLDLILTAAHCCSMATEPSQYQIKAGSVNLAHHNQVSSDVQKVFTYL